MRGSPFQRNFGISPVKQDKRTGIMPEIKSKEVKSNMPEVKSKEVKSKMPGINPDINPRLEERKRKRAEELKKPQKPRTKGEHSYTKTKVEEQLPRSRKKATTSEEKKYTYKEHEANKAKNDAINKQILKYKKAYFDKHGSSSGGSDEEWNAYQAGLNKMRSGYINR